MRTAQDVVQCVHSRHFLCPVNKVFVSGALRGLTLRRSNAFRQKLLAVAHLGGRSGRLVDLRKVTALCNQCVEFRVAQRVPVPCVLVCDTGNPTCGCMSVSMRTAQDVVQCVHSRHFLCPVNKVFVSGALRGLTLRRSNASRP